MSTREVPASFHSPMRWSVAHEIVREIFDGVATAVVTVALHRLLLAILHRQTSAPPGRKAWFRSSGSAGAGMQRSSQEYFSRWHERLPGSVFIPSASGFTRCQRWMAVQSTACGVILFQEMAASESNTTLFDRQFRSRAACWPSGRATPLRHAADWSRARHIRSVSEKAAPSIFPTLPFCADSPSWSLAKTCSRLSLSTSSVTMRSIRSRAHTADRICLHGSRIGLRKSAPRKAAKAGHA